MNLSRLKFWRYFTEDGWIERELKKCDRGITAANHVDAVHYDRDKRIAQIAKNTQYDDPRLKSILATIATQSSEQLVTLENAKKAGLKVAAVELEYLAELKKLDMGCPDVTRVLGLVQKYREDLSQDTQRILLPLVQNIDEMLDTENSGDDVLLWLKAECDVLRLKMPIGIYENEVFPESKKDKDRSETAVMVE